MFYFFKKLFYSSHMCAPFYIIIYMNYTIFYTKCQASGDKMSLSFLLNAEAVLIFSSCSSTSNFPSIA